METPAPTPTITNIPMPTIDPKITVHPSTNLAGDNRDLIAFQVYDKENRTVTIFLIHPDGSKLTELVTLSGTLLDRGYSWSPDGTMIAFSHASQDELRYLDYYQIYSIDIRSGEVSQLTDELEDHRNPVWSPDGSQIAFKTGEEYLLSKVSANGGPVELISDDPRVGADYSWSPDGIQIAYEIVLGFHRATIWLMDENGGNVRHFETEYLDGNYEDRYAGSPDWTPDGEHLVYFKQGDLYYEDIEGESSTRLTFTLDYPEIWFDLSRDGSMIAFLNSDGTYVFLKIIDLQGNVIAEERLGESYEVDFDWSNDSRVVVLTMDDQLWLYSMEDQSLTKILDCPANCRNPQWQP